MRKLFILVPSLSPTGPIKGAFALANALAPRRDVTVVALKHGSGADAPLDSRIRLVTLANAPGSWRKRIDAYRELLEQACGRTFVASVSMCLSADFVNSFCRRHAVTCASVRGNLVRNYRMDYGFLGAPLAAGHLCALRNFDYIVAMSEAMADQVEFYSRSRPAVIGNFVDEAALERYRCRNLNRGPMRFVYLASLSRRKLPGALLTAFDNLRRRGLDVQLDLIGDGPLRGPIVNQVQGLGLGSTVTLHGHLANPYPIVVQADALVLPSLSEGTPRAALEALYLGVPCVLRDTDGNAELIQSGENGVLFQTDNALPDAMLTAIELARRRSVDRDCLLPPAFRQETAATGFLKLLETSS